MSQETANLSPSPVASPSPAVQPKQRRGLTRSRSMDDSDDDYDAGALRRRNQRQGSRGLPLGGEDPTRAVSGTVNQLGQTARGVANVDGGGDRSGGQKNTLKLRLDLNIDVEISIKAKVHGDVTLSLLSFVRYQRNYAPVDKRLRRKTIVWTVQPFMGLGDAATLRYYELRWRNFLRIRVACFHCCLEVLSGHCTNVVERGRVWELGALVYTVFGLLSHLSRQRQRRPTPLVTKALSGDAKSLFAKRGTFPFPLARCIILYLFRGIAHAPNRRGVVHTDLKRDNIFLETTMSTEDINKLLASNPVSSLLPIPTLQEAMRQIFVVADFDSSNLKHVASQLIDTRSHEEISPLSLCPPEIIIDGLWDGKPDVWTFGCLIFNSSPAVLSSNEPNFMLHQVICYTGEDFGSQQLSMSSSTGQFFPITYDGLRGVATAYTATKPDEAVQVVVDGHAVYHRVGVVTVTIRGLCVTTTAYDLVGGRIPKGASTGCQIRHETAQPQCLAKDWLRSKKYCDTAGSDTDRTKNHIGTLSR
ncbi:hypothetical protein ARMGADRAFT_1030556 [Armillaria gallica]|uniref:Protein kinase domain-containing protein n=1 Tax=Armillaria gallica TaxID=47427 RepID=A0A2H3DVM0_ARMGA|nr:hypothetical protein ARMGADRAFT_1030556 [Armillaria gallica]